MANTLSTQSLVAKAVAFKWAAQEGFADHLEFQTEGVPDAVDNTGYTVNLRRQARHAGTVVSTGYDYNLTAFTQPGQTTTDSSGATVTSAGYSARVDATLPLIIDTRIEANLQLSMEELMFKVTAEEAIERHIEPAIVQMRDQANLLIAQKISKYAGASVVSDGTAALTTGIVNGIYKAKALMTSRGMAPNAKKNMIVNPNVMPIIGASNANVFKANTEKTWSMGEYQPIAGFDIYESALLDVPTVVAAGGTITVDSDTPARPTIWAQTWTLKCSGWVQNRVIKAGTKIQIKNSGTVINFCNPTVYTDTGYSAIFTVVSDATAVTAGGVVTLTLSEPFIASGAAQSVVADLVPGTSTVEIINSGLTRPSYAFSNDAVTLVSPKVKVPYGVKAQHFKLGGFNIALVEDHWPGTLQSITKLVLFLGAAVKRPESIVAIY